MALYLYKPNYRKPNHTNRSIFKGNLNLIEYYETRNIREGENCVFDTNMKMKICIPFIDIQTKAEAIRNI